MFFKEKMSLEFKTLKKNTFKFYAGEYVLLCDGTFRQQYFFIARMMVIIQQVTKCQ